MEIEEQAREQGWVDKEEWKGDPDKWSEATVFVEKGEKLLPLLRKRVERQSEEIKKLNTVFKEFGEFSKQSQDRLREQNKTLLSKLEEKRAQAITDGDGETFTQAEREIKQLERSQPQSRPELSPEQQKWLSDNDWYDQNSENYDEQLYIYAEGASKIVANQGYTGQAYLDELTRKVKRDNPGKFENAKKTRSNAVETGGTTSVKDPKARTYENLDAEAKSACDKFVKQGFTTVEDYVKNYEWEK